MFIITPISGRFVSYPILSMALPLCLTPLTPLRTTAQPGIGIELQTHANPKHIQANSVFQCTPPVKTFSLITKCKGSEVNSADLFNGKFKAGESCWLCGGRKEMLCGNCNGAGFIGGFLSTYDQ